MVSMSRGVDNVRGVVFNHFENHIQLGMFARPGVDNIEGI